MDRFSFFRATPLSVLTSMSSAYTYLFCCSYANCNAMRWPVRDDDRSTDLDRMTSTNYYRRPCSGNVVFVNVKATVFYSSSQNYHDLFRTVNLDKRRTLCFRCYYHQGQATASGETLCIPNEEPAL